MLVLEEDLVLHGDTAAQTARTGTGWIKQRIMRLLVLLVASVASVEVVGVCGWWWMMTAAHNLQEESTGEEGNGITCHVW